jgi:hypothetical protein
MIERSPEVKRKIYIDRALSRMASYRIRPMMTRVRTNSPVPILFSENKILNSDNKLTQQTQQTSARSLAKINKD